MKVLLRTDVDGLGRTGDVVDVARGYARNFLVPEGLAVAAIGGIAAQAEAMQRKRDLRSVAERADAERVAGRIAGVVLQVTAKASGSTAGNWRHCKKWATGAHPEAWQTRLQG